MYIKYRKPRTTHSLNHKEIKVMIKRFFNVQTVFVVSILILSIYACNSRENNIEKTFIKGVYGDPGTLLEAGYAFDELGMNAIFADYDEIFEVRYKENDIKVRFSTF